MGSRGALLGLSLTAMALAVAVILGRGVERGVPAPTTRIVPEAQGAAVERVTWRRSGAPDVVVAGDRVVAPIEAAVEPDVFDDVRGALELLSYARVGDGRDVAAELVVVVELAGHPPIELRIGGEEGEGGRRWVQRAGGPAYLVDAWAARALDLTLNDLRASKVFRTRGLTGVEIDSGAGSVILVGPSLDVRVAGGTARAAPARLAALRAVLRDARLSRFLDQEPPVGEAAALQVRTLGQHAGALALYGPCPGDPTQRLAVTPLGVGCISTDLAAAATALTTGHWIDDRLLPRPPHEVTDIQLPTTHVIRRGATWRFAPTPNAPTAPAPAPAPAPATAPATATATATADATAIDAWLTSLATAQAHPAPLPDGVPFDVAARATIDGAVLTIDATGRRVRRGDEAVVLALIEPVTFAADFRPRQVMSFEPSALRAVSRDGRWVRRGETLSDWPDVHNPAALLAFRDVAARLRAESFVDAPVGDDAIRYELEFDAEPGGSPVRRTLEIDRRCRARVGASPAVIRVNSKDCKLLRAPW